MYHPLELFIIAYVLSVYYEAVTVLTVYPHSVTYFHNSEKYIK